MATSGSGAWTCPRVALRPSSERSLERDSPDARWAAAAPAYAQAIRAYTESLGQDPDSSATAATIRTNTDLVPRRAHELLTLLRLLAGVDSIDGQRVLDLGSGWG